MGQSSLSLHDVRPGIWMGKTTADSTVNWTQPRPIVFESAERRVIATEGANCGSRRQHGQ